MASHPNRHVSIKLTRFYMRIVGFWHAENYHEQLLLHAALAYTIAAVTFAIAVEGVDLYYSWGDFNAVTYNACCTMPLIVIALKVIVFIVRRDVVIDLITFSEKNFWGKKYDEFGENILKECERRGVLLLYTLSFSVQATVVSYVTAPIIENIGLNDTDRNLPFRLWVNLPIKVTPYYEITYMIQSLSTVHSGICFFCFDNLMGILNIHVVGQFKILQNRLEKLCDGNSSGQPFEVNLITNVGNNDYYAKDELQSTTFDRDKKAYCELKECIKQHLVLIDYVQKLEDVFNLILLCQMGVSSLFICLGGFQIFVAKLSTMRRVIFVLHLTAAFSQLLLFTWTCNEIIVQSLEVAEAAFRSKWYTMSNTVIGRSIRHGLIMVMMRSRRACYISAGKFSPMSLQAFTSILSTTLSYYTLLRQVSEDL